jgi:hypothetical protein
MKIDILKVILDKNNKLETDKCLVFNTYKNISIKSLMKTLDNVSNIVNLKLNKRRKYITQNTSVMFCDFYQIAHNNVHSHSYLSVPECFDKEKVFELVKQTFERIDNNHKCFYENAIHIYELADYSSREFNQNNIESYRFH